MSSDVSSVMRQFSFKNQQMIENELDPGESIRWVGQPRLKRFFARSLPIFFFGIPWTAFSIFWVFAAMGFAIPTEIGDDFFSWIFPLFGIPFILVGFGMLSAPFWGMRTARRTFYVITNKRAILFEGGWQTKVKTFDQDQLKVRERKQKGDGSGDIILDRVVSYGKNGARSTEVGFLGVEQVRIVDGYLRDVCEGTVPAHQPFL